jgi:thiol-disulfide isomerase/thioredoxin
MTAIAIVSRAVLACVFAVAAAGKLLDIPGSQAAMEQFGLRGWVARLAGRGLPLLEGAVAVALLVDTSARAAAIAALALLAAFVVGIALMLARGKQAECHCFGAIHSAEIGPATLARNIALAALALLAAISHRQGAISGWVGHLHGSSALAAGEGAALLAVLIGSGVFASGLLKRHGAMLLRVDELEARLGAREGAGPTGSAVAAKAALAFTVSGLHGETATLQSLLAPGHPLLMLFTDPGCGPCTALMPEVAQWQSAHTGALSIALISTGTMESNRSKAAEHGVTGVYVQDERAINAAYEINGTPSAVLVNPHGMITEPVATGADNIRELVQRALAPTMPEVIQVPALAPAPPAPAAVAPVPAMPVALAAGTQVPHRRLTSLDGRRVNLAPGQARETLLVFWNPQCGFCERLENELLEWESGRGSREPRLVVIADGPEEANRALPFASPVVLDPGSPVSRAFGAAGTPSALLIDSRGRVASELAVGGPAVLTLASAGRSVAA